MKPSPGPFAGREFRPTLLVSAFFAAVGLVLFYPALIFGLLIYGNDTLTLGVPFHTEVLRSLAAHQWPLWMPDVFGGMPGIASCNLQFLYPTDFIGCLSGLALPALDGLDAAVHVAMAGLGMFLFLRRLGRGFSASLLGGFFFALSGSQISQLNGGFYNFVEGIALVPWAFWAAHKGLTERSFLAWGLCGLAFALQILAGASQLCAYTLPAIACFALSSAWNGADEAGGPDAKKGGLAALLPAALGLGLALGSALLLSAPQILPTLQYVPLSVRQGWTHAQFNGGSLPLSEALTWVVPGFYGWRQFTSEYFGLLPWALAAAGLVALWRCDRRVRWMAGLALTSFFFSQSRWTPFYAPFHRLPLVSGFRAWSRILFLLTFAVSALAAFGWDALRAERTRAAALRGAWIFLGLALAAIAAAAASGPGHALAHFPPLSGPGIPADPRALAALLAAQIRDSAWTSAGFGAGLAVLLLLLARRPHQGLALLLALTFHAFDQKQVIRRFVQYMPLGTAVGHPRFLRPPPRWAGTEPWRVYESDNCYPNNSILLGYENLSGAESLPLRSFQGMADAMDARPADWASLMNERYYFRHSKISSAVPGDTVAIYENRGVFPRAWLVDRVLPVSGDEQAYRVLADPGFQPRMEVALNADPGLRPRSGTGPAGSVLWLSRGPQTESLDVSTGQDAVLVLSNAWYPSWRCAVDGLDAPVLKADGGLQAVVLRAGRHRVDFSFDNGLFNDALAACLAGLLFLFGLYRFDVQSKRSRSGNIHAPRP